MAPEVEKTGPNPPSESPPSSREGKRRSAFVQLKGLGSLERLRDRVEVAAHELKRLREENESLSKRIKELESRPGARPSHTFLPVDNDPEILKRKISGFIEAIDRHLERERNKS